MINHSIIQKSQLEGAHRLDAEYYQLEYLEIYQKLSRLKTAALGEFCRIADGDHSKIPGFVKVDGVRYLRAKDLQSFFIDDSDPVFVSKGYFQKIKRSHIKPLDIVLSIMGTVGNLAVVLPQYGVITANRAVSIISPKSQELFSSYLIAVYLESKFGVVQRERESMGGVQQRVNLDDLASIRIPIISKIEQKTIEAIFNQAIKQYENSISLYSQAENLLLEELGLKDFEVEDDLSYIVNLSEVKSAHRADPEYFQPKYEKLESRIKNSEFTKLPHIVENVVAKFNPRPDENYRYVELSNINSSIGVIDGFSEVLGKESPSRARRVLKSGDIIVSAVEGSLEKVALVSKEQEGYLGSTGFFQFRSKEILPEVLLILAKSIVFKMQLQKQTAGTILTAVPREAVNNVLVPILPKPIQQKIADFVQKSHEACKKSKELLEQAKQKVEELIEK